MKIVGGSLRVMGLVRNFSESMESRKAFKRIEREAFLSALMTVRLLLGR